MLDEKFLQSVRNKQFHFFGNKVTTEYNWYQFIKLLKTHPDGLLTFNDEAKRFQLSALETRSKVPEFAKQLLSDLKNTFNLNRTSLIAFGGLDVDHESFKVHRDGMDVLYVQVLGSVDWSIWKSYQDQDYFYPSDTAEGSKIWEQTLIPGDAIWIPRGTYHHVRPLSGRVGFSFGIEKEPNPSTYI